MNGEITVDDIPPVPTDRIFFDICRFINFATMESMLLEFTDINSSDFYQYGRIAGKNPVVDEYICNVRDLCDSIKVKYDEIMKDTGYEYNNYFAYVNTLHPLYLAWAGIVELSPESFLVIPKDNIMKKENFMCVKDEDYGVKRDNRLRRVLHSHYNPNNLGCGWDICKIR